MTDEIDVYKRRYEREKNARIEAETLLDSKSTELYYSHENLKKLTTNLENMVYERTAELKIARDQAIASNNAKSIFLGNCQLATFVVSAKCISIANASWMESHQRTFLVSHHSKISQQKTMKIGFQIQRRMF